MLPSTASGPHSPPSPPPGLGSHRVDEAPGGGWTTFCCFACGRSYTGFFLHYIPGLTWWEQESIASLPGTGAQGRACAEKTRALCHLSELEGCWQTAFGQGHSVISVHVTHHFPYLYPDLSLWLPAFHSWPYRSVLSAWVFVFAALGRWPRAL